MHPNDAFPKSSSLVAKSIAAMMTLFSINFFQLFQDAEAQENTDVLNFSGNVIVFEEEPSAAWIIGRIQNGDYFHLRRVLRRNNISTIVLHSPGGSVYEALQMGAIVNDQGLTTYIPKDAMCASACSYIFFAGKNRVANGLLGVHQFYGTEDRALMDQVQFTVSEILGFLNEFETPPFVYEYMFENQEMYFFNASEIETIQRTNSQSAQEASNIFDSINTRFSEYLNYENQNESVSTLTTSVRTVNVPPSEELRSPPQPDRPSASPNGTRRAIQYQLNRVGCHLGSVDGVIGVLSIAALRAFRNATNNPKPVTQDDFIDYNIVREIRSHRGIVCITPPSIPTPNISGDWSVSLNCPYSKIEAIATVRKTSTASYSIIYRNDRGDFANGTMNQTELRATGSLRLSGGTNDNFSISRNQYGTIFSGSSTDGCRFIGNKL